MREIMHINQCKFENTIIRILKAVRFNVLNFKIYKISNFEI